MSVDLSEELAFVFDRISKGLSEHRFEEVGRMEGEGHSTLVLSNGLCTINVLQSDRELLMNPTVSQLANLARVKVANVLRHQERAA